MMGLNTVELRGSGGSNPSLSAEKKRCKIVLQTILQRFSLVGHYKIVLFVLMLAVKS